MVAKGASRKRHKRRTAKSQRVAIRRHKAGRLITVQAISTTQQKTSTLYMSDAIEKQLVQQILFVSPFHFSSAVSGFVTSSSDQVRAPAPAAPSPPDDAAAPTPVNEWAEKIKSSPGGENLRGGDELGCLTQEVGWGMKQTNTNMLQQKCSRTYMDIGCMD